MSWEDVKKELIEKKGVSEEQANKLGEMVCLRGEPFKLIEELESKKIFEEKGKEALEEMKVLFKYLR